MANEIFVSILKKTTTKTTTPTKTTFNSQLILFGTMFSTNESIDWLGHCSLNVCVEKDSSE